MEYRLSLQTLVFGSLTCGLSLLFTAWIYETIKSYADRVGHRSVRDARDSRDDVNGWPGPDEWPEAPAFTTAELEETGSVGPH